MKPTLDELYLSINTDLTAHDLASVVFGEVLNDWFSIACAATDKGEFLIGDLADDTKLDGRGRLPLPGETVDHDFSSLNQTLDSESVREAILNRLDSLDLEDDKAELQISCIGAVPSGFRRRFNKDWRPRCSPSFYFRPGRSIFEISLFDALWLAEPDDLDELTNRLAALCDSLGERRTTLVEFECDGRFLATEEDWRIQFAPLQLGSREMRG